MTWVDSLNPLFPTDSADTRNAHIELDRDLTHTRRAKKRRPPPGLRGRAGAPLRPDVIWVLPPEA